MLKIAVAMSVYANDKPEILVECIDSIISQTYDDFVVFINVDGSVSNKVYQLLENYKSSYPQIFEIDYCKENKGLAFQLNSIVDKVAASSSNFQFIARMDADDINDLNRFSKQVSFFLANPEVAVLGSSVDEFYADGSVFYKSMPQQHDEIYKNIIKRCPFNHPTVMFNLATLSFEDLNYPSTLMNTQDYYLWVDLAKKGYRFANIDEPLLKFRVDNNFHKRRGLQKAKNDFMSRLYAIRELDMSTPSNWLHSFLLFFLRISPSWIKNLAYEKLR